MVPAVPVDPAPVLAPVPDAPVLPIWTATNIWQHPSNDTALIMSLVPEVVLLPSWEFVPNELLKPKYLSRLSGIKYNAWIL